MFLLKATDQITKKGIWLSSPELLFGKICKLKMAKNTNIRISLPAVCFVWQIAMIILFGVFIRYNEESDTRWIEHRRRKNISTNLENDFYYRYPSK